MINMGDLNADLIVVGSVNLDVFVRVVQFPRPGETVLGSESLFEVGGKGANQAIASARAGAHPVLLARVGDDEHSALILRRLGELGVNTSGVLSTPGIPSGTAHVTVDQAGESTVCVAPGANAQLEPVDFEGYLSRAGSSAVIVVQGEVPQKTIEWVIETAAALGSTLVLNMAPYVPIAHSLLETVDWLVLNEVEFGDLYGITPNNVSDVMRILERETFSRRVVVSMGGDGAVLRSFDGRVTHVPAPYVEQVVDTTGAGDALVGVLAAALVEGMSEEKALSYAVHCASMVVTQLGAAPSYPDFQILTGGRVEHA